MKLLLSLLLVGVLVGHVVSINAILKSWNSCSGKTYKTYINVFNFKHLGNYVHKVDANISAEVDIGANLKYSTNIYKNNKRLPVSFNGKDVCKGVLVGFGDVAGQVFGSLNPKVEAKCPIKKGVYTARGLTVDAKMIKVPVPLKGEFRLEIPIREISSNKEIACIEMVAELQ